MINKFNAGDTVKYISPYPHNKGYTTTGVVLEVNSEHFSYHGYKKLGYFVSWIDGSTGWIAEGNLSLEKATTTVSDVKALKEVMETEILRLIQEFTKKTNLEVQDIEIDKYRALVGECLYQVRVKVDF